jgi:hypothetical protein
LSDLRLLIFAFATRAASALGDCFFSAAVVAALVDCGCAAVSAPCSIGCTFIGPVAGGRSLAIPDNARGWPLVSFLLPLFVWVHPLIRRDLLRRCQLDHVHRVAPNRNSGAFAVERGSIPESKRGCAKTVVYWVDLSAKNSHRMIVTTLDPNRRNRGRGKEAVLGLVLASGVCGLLLGRYFKIYATLPTVFVLLAVAYFVGHADGLMKGILAFVFSLIAMQGCFLIGATIRVFSDNFAPTKAPAEDFL